MFHSGNYYKNNALESEILRTKLKELLTQKKELTDTHFDSTSPIDDEQYIKENEKRLNEITSKINVLTNALIQMGFTVNSTDINNIIIDGIFTELTITDTSDNNNTNMSNINKLLTSRIKSSHLQDHFISILNIKYETELEIIRIRRHTRLRTRICNRIYHIDPDLTLTQIYKKIDNTPLTKNNSGLYCEHIWCKNIDDALQTYIDGDIFELAEGKHVISGTYQIYGKLHIKGMATSNWKTLIENKYDSDHFIWCIGSNTRVTFENVLIRSNGSHCGIVKVSLRSQFIGRKVLFHCNGLEGICVEHESKLWLDSCVLLNSVGSGIHINTGCKCLLTQSTIVNCGEGDYQLIQGQGAIVIYGNDINYAQHLVRKTPSLRFPSMDNVPKMVLDPDPTLASMLRGRTYLYVQECKIKNNFGFGISFEITSSFNKLSVPCIASMMDVSITVRETHFTENTFGNMGKIPAYWIKHNKNSVVSLFNEIKHLNPSLFVGINDNNINNELTDNDGDLQMKMDNDNTSDKYSQHSAQIIPLTEQALRAKNETDELYSSDIDNNIDDNIDNNNNNTNNILLDLENLNNSDNDSNNSDLRSNRSKSEPPNSPNSPNNNMINTNTEIVENNIKLSDKTEMEQSREFSLGSNSSSKIIKMRQERRTLRLSAPPSPTHLLSAPPVSSSSHVQIDNDSNDNKLNDKEIEIDNENDNNNTQPLLRRSMRIKDKQQKELNLKLQKGNSEEVLIANIRKQTKTEYKCNNNKKNNIIINNKKLNNNKILLPVMKSKKQIKNKKKRRRFSRNKNKSLNNNNNDNDDDDKENNDNIFISNIDESPKKRRKINTEIMKQNGKSYVVDNNKSNDNKSNDNQMIFPKRTESDSDDVEMIEQKLQLRRSTRKASIRATNKLMKRNKKKILSQSVRSNDNKRKNNRTNRRRHSTSTKR